MARARALAVLSILFLPLAGRAADVPAASRIDAVTVYRSTARVTRVAQASLPAGDGRVLLEGLPVGLDDDSVRVSGKGSAKAKIHGVSVEPVTREESAAAEARVAEERLEKLAEEDRALDDRARLAQARAKFVESLRSTYSEERAKNLAVRGVAAKEWAELAAFVEGELAAAAAETRKVDVAKRDLARRRTAAQAELQKVQAKRGQTTKTVAVEVAADQGGAFELTVSYVVPSASWSPIWDARLDPASSKVELAFQASVQQSSGEDWKGVKLALSTAQPGRGLFVPQLEPVFLQKAQPAVAYRQRKAYGGGVPSAAPSARAEAPSMAAREESMELDVEMVTPTASVEQGLLAATFTAPRRETVDGAGRARKVALARFPLAAEIARTSAPRVDASTFLTAKAVNDTGFPLPAGTAGVYVGDEFVGRAQLAGTPVGGELELAFGADERVEVERRVLERRHETKGIVSKDEIWKYRVRVAVKSRYATPVKMTLLELVPVSREQDIVVKLLDGTTAATREDPERPGVRAFELALEPGKEKVVELRYEVRYPRGFPIQGLE